VPLDIDGASATGSYKGQVAIGGTPISITVAVGDPWWLCALAILFGLAFAAFTTVATQRWWGGRQARLAADAIPRTLEAAVLAHNRRTKCLPRLNVDDSTAYVAKVKE